MSLDPTAREANVIDSLKKYFVDNLFNVDDPIPLGFDSTISVPEVQGTPSTVRRWVNIDFGTLDIATLSTFTFDLYLCTRKDNEGFVLAQTRDRVMGLLVDTNATYPDGMMRIPFYRSVPGGYQNWTQIGSFVIQDITESGRFLAPDETKFKIITPRLRFASIA